MFSRFVSHPTLDFLSSSLFVPSSIPPPPFYWLFFLGFYKLTYTLLPYYYLIFTFITLFFVFSSTLVHTSPSLLHYFSFTSFSLKALFILPYIFSSFTIAFSVHTSSFYFWIFFLYLFFPNFMSFFLLTLSFNIFKVCFPSYLRLFIILPFVPSSIPPPPFYLFRFL